MPRNFPDMGSLERAAETWRFRPPHDGENERDYRAALADFVLPQDSVESMEIRTGHGWDQFTAEELMDLLLRRGR